MKKKLLMAGGLLFLISFFFVLSSLFLGSKKTLVLRLGHDMPEGTPQHDGALKFKELVEESSQGSLQIDVYPNQSLGTDPIMVEMVQRGELAFSIPPTSKISSLAPNIKILDIPYLFETKEALYKALDSSFGDVLFNQLQETGIKPITMWESGFKNFTANKKITRPEDFSGLRFRVMPSDTLINQSIALSAFPTHTDFHNILEKLTTGEIDCQENPISSIFSMKIYEKQTYLMESRHGYLGQLFIASTKILEKLSAPQRQIILNSAIKAGLYQRERVSSYEKIFLSKINKSGTKVVSFSKEMKAKFIDSFKGIYYENRKFLSNYKNLINPLLLPFLRPHIAIGLNLSFSYQAFSSALSIKRGAEIAIDEINKQGGLLGLPLLLLTKTHDGFPRRGIKNLKDFSNDESIVAILGGMHSPVVLAERETVNALRIPYLIPWAAATSIISKDNPYVYRFSVRDSHAGKKLVEQASKKGKKASLLLENTGWGKSNEKAISRAIVESKKLELDETYWFEWGRKDFSEILKRIYSSHSDVIIFVGNSPEGVDFIKSLSNGEKVLPVVSHWGITGGRFWDETKEILNRVDFSFLTTFGSLNSDKFSNLVKTYRKKYNYKKESYFPAFFGTVHSYELLKILALAVKEGNTLDPDQISKSLLNISSYQGLFTHYKNIFSKPGLEREALEAKDIWFASYDELGNVVVIDAKK